MTLQSRYSENTKRAAVAMLERGKGWSATKKKFKIKSTGQLAGWRTKYGKNTPARKANGKVVLGARRKLTYFDEATKQNALTMLENGKSVRDVAKHVGASKGTVENWSRGKGMGKPGRNRSYYSDEFKVEAVRRLREGELAPYALAKELGVSDVSLRTWLRESEKPDDAAIRGKEGANGRGDANGEGDALAGAPMEAIGCLRHAKMEIDRKYTVAELQREHLLTLLAVDLLQGVVPINRDSTDGG